MRSLSSRVVFLWELVPREQQVIPAPNRYSPRDLFDSNKSVQVNRCICRSITKDFQSFKTFRLPGDHRGFINFIISRIFMPIYDLTLKRTSFPSTDLSSIAFHYYNNQRLDCRYESICNILFAKNINRWREGKIDDNIFRNYWIIQNTSIHGGNDRIEGVDVSTNWKVISPDNLLHGRKKNGGVSYRSIDRAELTESRSVSPIEANSNGETRGETSELSRRPSSSLFPRTFLSWFLALVAALSFSPPSCLFYFRVVSSPGNSMNSKQLSQCLSAIEFFFFSLFFFVSKNLCVL